MDLCKRMTRTRVKGNGSKAASSPSTEPNFYMMDACHETGLFRDEIEDKFEGRVDMIMDLAIIDDEEAVNEVLSDEEIVLLPQEIMSANITATSTEVGTPSPIPWTSLAPMSPQCCSSSGGSYSASGATMMPGHLPIVSPPSERRTLVSPPSSPHILSSISIPCEISTEKATLIEGIHSGDQIFFEGLPFHYLETKDIEDSLLD
jgi:hypothetical protein